MNRRVSYAVAQQANQAKQRNGVVVRNAETLFDPGPVAAATVVAAPRLTAEQLRDPWVLIDGLKHQPRSHRCNDYLIGDIADQCLWAYEDAESDVIRP